MTEKFLILESLFRPDEPLMAKHRQFYYSWLVPAGGWGVKRFPQSCQE